MNNNLPNRKSIRLHDYDYSLPGWYFITICTQNRKKLFGDIVGADPRVRPMDPRVRPMDPRVRPMDPRVRPVIILNHAGQMISRWWNKIPEKFPNIELGHYQIMPNHIHSIIHIINGSTHGSTPTVGTVVQWYKTMTTNEYINHVKNDNWIMFDKRLWQRNFYENITRTENDLDKIQKYILFNPDMWNRDRNNMNHI